MLNASKKDGVFHLLYTARNFLTGRTVTYDVYDETDTMIVDDNAMTELDGQGVYEGDFTPPSLGEYTIILSDNGVKRGAHSLKVTENDIDTLAAKIDATINPVSFTGIGL